MFMKNMKIMNTIQYEIILFFYKNKILEISSYNCIYCGKNIQIKEN